MPTLDPFQLPRPATRKTLYAQVREQLTARIVGGEWAPGESLPNEYVLSNEFDVSIGTVRRAVADLEANGVLLRKQGRGTYVADEGPAALCKKFCSLRRLDGTRLDITFELIGLDRRPASAYESALFAIADGADVSEILQRLSADGRTIGLERSVLPSHLVPRLETQVQFGQQLYPVLSHYGLIVTRVEDTIGIEHADATQAGQLSCQTGLPLLATKRLTYALDGRTIELRIGRYLPDNVRYVGAARVV